MIASYRLTYHRLRSGGESTILSQYPGILVTSVRLRVSDVDDQCPSSNSPARIYMGPFESGMTEKSVKEAVNRTVSLA